LKSVRVADSLLDSIIGRHSKEESVTAAQNCPIVEPEVHAQARSQVVLLVGQIAGQPRQEAEFLRMRVGIEVVAGAEIQCQSFAHLPIVLQPTRKEVPNNVVPVFRIGGRMENKTGDGGERRQIPGGGVVPNREERLQIRRRSCSIGPDLAVTSQTPAKLVVVSHVLAAQFQVMLPKRGGEVIANRPRVLQNVYWAGADGIAAQYHDHGTPTQHGMIWEVTALPSNARLVRAFLIRQAASDRVHRGVADDVSQRREVLWGHPLPGAAGRGMVGG